MPLPVVKDIGDSPEATSGHATRACVAAVDSPKHEVALVWIELQQQHHSLATQLMNLEETTEKVFQLLVDNSQQPPYKAAVNYTLHTA